LKMWFARWPRLPFRHQERAIARRCKRFHARICLCRFLKVRARCDRDAYTQSMSAQSAIVESSELANTFRIIRAHRKRPEGSGILQNESANFGLFREVRDLAVGSPRKEKELIEVAHPNLF